MALGTNILIWLIPLIVILISVFILWIVTSIIRKDKFKEMTAEDIDNKEKAQTKKKKF